MCGIAGYIYTDNKQIISTNEIHSMLDMQKHRGPDDSGIVAFSLCNSKKKEYKYLNSQTVEDAFEGILGFNRLSILDLSENGHQPMCSPDGMVILTLNGEIYNAFDLKPGLEADGCKFKSTTDTEVVLYLYLKYGFRGMIEKLNGMFAIVVVDLREQKLFIARDRFGIKPMYYYRNNNILAFSSELKSFYALDLFKAELHIENLDEYLVFRNNLNDTLIRNVQAIPPGHFITHIPGNGIISTKYFDINNYIREQDSQTNFQDQLELTQSILKTSVRSQLMSDVKLGCQLSGGIDSSLITWFAKEIKQDDLLESVSIIFENPYFSEKPYIDKVANQLGIIAHQFTLNSVYYYEQMQKACWHLEQPINHPNSIGIYLLAQKAKQHVTVLLSGEGADEVFGGYSRFYSVMYPYSNRSFWAGLIKAGTSAFSYLQQYAKPFYRANMNVAFLNRPMAVSLKDDFSYENAISKRNALYATLSGCAFDKQVKYDISIYLPDLLTRQDKMSMAHSIENRVPFLDNEVVAHSFDIPLPYLIKRKVPEGKNSEKYILKKMCAQIFGNDFAFRNKVGFGIPVREFIGKPQLKAFLTEQIIPGLKKRQILNAKKVETWINNLATINSKELDALWVAVSLEVWMQQYIDR